MLEFEVSCEVLGRDNAGSSHAANEVHFKVA